MFEHIVRQNTPPGTSFVLRWLVFSHSPCEMGRESGLQQIKARLCRNSNSTCVRNSFVAYADIAMKVFRRYVKLNLKTLSTRIRKILLLTALIKLRPGQFFTGLFRAELTFSNQTNTILSTVESFKSG